MASSTHVFDSPSLQRLLGNPAAVVGLTIVSIYVLLALGRPLLFGFSRKSSLGKLAGDPGAKVGPLGASVAAAVASYERGATILRVHDVREHVDALAVAQAVSGV